MHAPQHYICPFCLVVRGVHNEHVYTRQEDIVYQTSSVTAFVSSHQSSTRGMNVLVIPNEHYENLYELPERYGAELLRAQRLIALAFKATYRCHGVSTRQHNEPAGYQDVWHYHVHITPRFNNDLLYLKLNLRHLHFNKVAPHQVRAEHAATLRGAIESLAARHPSR